MAEQGTLVVVSGFSGVGKGTVMKSLMDRHAGYVMSVSATTREPRAGEKDGREYFFVSEDRFTGMIERGELIEHAVYCGHYYGTPRAFVEENLLAGRDVILEIEIQGARKIRALYPEAVLLFLMPPSAQELERRLTGRGTETEEVIQGRLERARKEAEGIEDYDYVFVNDNADRCADEIHALIRANRHRVSFQRELITRIRAQLQGSRPHDPSL